MLRSGVAGISIQNRDVSSIRPDICDFQFDSAMVLSTISRDHIKCCRACQSIGADVMKALFYARVLLEALRHLVVGTGK
jgi:hypothetical protein